MAIPWQGLQQEQKQSQTLVLAPQLRQSLKILQAPTLDLRNEILGELETNPALEELPMEGTSLESALGNDEEASLPDSSEEMNFETLQQLDRDWREQLAREGSNQIYTSEDSKKRQHFFNSLVSGISLQEHLMGQAKLSDLDEEQIEAMGFLIGSLDDRGYLTASLLELSLLSRKPLGKLKEAHRVLKTLDPPGIGAEDLQDCLLIQLKQRDRENSLAARVVKHHFNLLPRRRIPEIAKRTGNGLGEVEDAIEEIATLDPSPGRKFSDDTNHVVTPDVTVEKDNGYWTVSLNDEYIPRLRISNVCKEIIARGNLSKEEKEYIREKIRSGKFIINSIEQRQQTIEKITRCILTFQKDFFEDGLGKLRPLTMIQVAEEVGVHETTVSRAIAGKYIKTPHGLFPLKYFFTPGYSSGDGESLSNTTIKEMVAQIIDAEDPAKPFSDQVVVNKLKGKDIEIARRTVAKYREELGIPPTYLRRRYSD
ncbi:MAG: RNA polymerase factor sigma-54 [Opitutae bacterium]|nr:RNA polymerase factor sigma-54 [Opitutae bacterium]